MNIRYGKYALAAFIALITFAVYLPAIGNDFVTWDDIAYVSNNVHIRYLDWEFIKWAFTSFYASNWHPLTWASHALDYALWGLDPAGHHFVNILLHSLNTFFVVLLSMRLIMALKTRHAMLSPWYDVGTAQSFILHDHAILIAGGVTGALFGLHPLHVESVAWVPERKDLLCALFYLVSVMAYLRHCALVQPGHPRVPECIPETNPHSAGIAGIWHSNHHYRLSLFFFALSLLSKPMAVTLPLVLLVLDWYPLQRYSSACSFKAVLREKIPFIALSMVSSVLTVMAQQTGEAMALMATVPFWARILVAAKALISYLGLMVLPAGLSPYYPYPASQEMVIFQPRYLMSIVLVLVITRAVLGARKQKIWRSVWLYYILTLLPVIGLIQVGTQAMADRYTYLPSLGPFLLTGAGVAWMFEKEEELRELKRAVQGLTFACIVLLFIAMSVLTRQQILIWTNGVTLWSHVLSIYPDTAFAYNNRGLAFQEKGQLDRAVGEFSTAITLGPHLTYPHRNRGIVLAKMGQYERAIQDFNISLELDPNDVDVYSSRGHAYKHMGYTEASLDDFTKAIRLRPDDDVLYVDRGVTFHDTANSARAMEDYTKALRLNPSNENAYIYRGILFKEQGHYEKALADYTKAISLNPASVEAYNNRGVAYKQLKQFDRALADYDRAIALKPSFYLAYMNRAMIFQMQGQISKAVDDLSVTIKLNPDFAGAYLVRGQLYQQEAKRGPALKDFKKACELGSHDGCSTAGLHRGR